LSITLVIQSQPVELMSMPAGVTPGDIRSSLQVTLANLTSDDVHGVVTFYASEVGAFDELAANLSGPGAPMAASLRLDTALTPNLDSGLTGFQELTTINQAIGVLISRGNNLQHANDLLLRVATNTRDGLYESAARILASL
jgi:hypothetical protein